MATSAIPSTILVIGSGVFGLSTALALAKRPAFAQSKIIVLDRATFPTPDGSSIDSSRIVRADYADPAYAQLMREAREQWHGELGAEERYSETGLAIIAENSSDPYLRYFLEQAFTNVVDKLKLKLGKRQDGAEVTRIDSEETAKEVMGTTGGNIGSVGYVNWTAGWAHATNAMIWTRKQAEAIGRVEFRHGEVKHLLFNDAGHVEGAELENGQQLRADLTILASGAWTPKLIDLRGRASATGQVLAYVDITQEEQERLAKNPTFISASNSCFIIPPVDRVLKVARHGFGYANPTEVPNPEKPGEMMTVSLPWTKQDDPNADIPAEGAAACRSFLRQCIPDLADRPFVQTRICWYTDTPKGDYIIDYHPSHPGLFIATGGSGHAYKFLPVIGERIVDRIEDVHRDELGIELQSRWTWPKERLEADHVWTDDWRGGSRGMILREELAKS